MSATSLRRFALGLVLAGAAIDAALAFTVSELQRLLQSATTTQAIPFRERRESPWLSTPTESRGTMHSSPEQLEKRVETPRQETWRLMGDRMEWVGPGGVGSKQILFTEAPAVAALADALRRVVAGDLITLQKTFRIELRGDQRQWTVQLQPHSADVARSLDHLELQGSGGRLQTIIIVERHGERTTTHLNP